MDPVELTAEGLLLRAWQPEDANPVFQACQDPAIQHWTNVPSPYLPRHAEHLVGRISPEGWRTGRAALFAVFDEKTGKLLGSHGLVHLDLVAGVGEVGFWVAPWARGDRVAERATRAVSRWALDVLRLRQIEWRARLGNHASRLVAERVGFVVEGPARGLVPNRDGTRSDGWRATLFPGEVRSEPSAWFAPDGPGSRRLRSFHAPQPRLTAGLAVLRPPAEKDVDLIVTACTDPESTRWTNIPVPYTRVNAEVLVRTHAPLCWARGDGAIFTLADADGTWVGRVDLHLSAEDPRIGSVAYLIAPHARGRGYATAGVRAVCDWGLAALGLTRIVWRAHVGNTASRRVAEKVGFVIEGTERGGCEQRGERRDAWVAALLAAS